MNTVLLVDADATRRDKLLESLRALNQFAVLAADSGEAALELIHEREIAVVVTRLDLPQLDGLDLLGHLSRQATPAVCLLCAASGCSASAPGGQPAAQLQWLPDDVDFTRMASAIFESLDHLDEGLAPRSLTLAEVMPLIELRHKTCRLEVTSSSGEKGFLYFRDGVLLDALANGQGGETAALALASWEAVTLQFGRLPPQRAVGRRIGAAVQARLGGGHVPASSGAASDPPSAVDTAGALHPRRPALDSEAHRVSGVWSPELESLCSQGAVGMLDANGRLLELESARQRSVSRMIGAELGRILGAIRSAAAECRLTGASRGVTLQTSSHVVMMRPVECPQRATYHLLGVLPLPCNLYFLSLQLDRAAARISATLTAS
jgi:CheY-like chemotaxis protein